MRRCWCLNTEWIVLEQCYAAKCCHFHTMASAHKKIVKETKLGEKLKIRCRDAAGIQRMSRYTSTTSSSHRGRRILQSPSYTPLRVIERSRRNGNGKKKKENSADFGPATACRLILIQQSKYKVHARMLRDEVRVRDCERAMYLEKGT